MHDIDPRFADTKYAVEANRFETHYLWREYNERLTWEQDCRGFGLTVGTINGMPVFVSFLWNKLNGHNILFYSAESQVVDHRMVEAFLDQHCPVPRTDAMNFHNVIHVLNIEFKKENA